MDGDENGKDGGHEMEGESVGKNSWNRGALKGRCGNLVCLKLPGTYESDPNEFLVMKGTESQQAISSSQERLLVEGLSCIQLIFWPRYSYGNPLNNPGCC